MLVAGGVLIMQHTTINTIVPVVTTDDSDHTCDWGTLGLMVIHLCYWLYTFILELYSEMLAWRLTVRPNRQMSGQ
jgi:hypothetical protein